MKQAFINFFQTEIIVILKVIILVIKEVFIKKIKISYDAVTICLRRFDKVYCLTFGNSILGNNNW